MLISEEYGFCIKLNEIVFMKRFIENQAIFIYRIQILYKNGVEITLQGQGKTREEQEDHRNRMFDLIKDKLKEIY